MAYAEHTITTIAEIPALVADFAETLGWINSGVCVLQHPDYMGLGPGGLTFTVTGGGNILNVACSGPGNSAYVQAPVLGAVPGTSPAPTKLFLIGMMTPEPYIAIVIQFGYNSYRHMYLGFMEKIGDYEGGEIIGGHNGPHLAFTGGPLDWQSRGGVHTLFKGTQSLLVNSANCGGVHVDHADNPSHWRHFRTSGLSSQFFDPASMDGEEAIGGFGDGYNDMFAARGRNNLAGAAVLSPINLFATQPVTSEVRFRPIGRPAGIRLINIANLEPEATTSISTEVWHSFAALSKRSEITMPSSDGSTLARFRSYESSYHLGYAYRSE